jgi:chromosome segregation ATPase
VTHQERQALVHQLDEAEAQIVELAEEVILLRKELTDAHLQLALWRTARAVAGQSVAEVNVRAAETFDETFDEIFDDTIDVAAGDQP